MARVELYRYEAADGKLPRICLVCGEPAPHWVRRQLTAFSGGGLLRNFLGTVVRESLSVPLDHEPGGDLWMWAPLCDDHRRYWLKRELCGFGSLALLVVAGIFGLAGNHEHQVIPQSWLGWTLTAALAVWGILVLTVRRRSIRVAELTRTRFTLVRVSPEFAEAIAQRRLADERATPPLPSLPPNDNPFSGLRS